MADKENGLPGQPSGESFPVGVTESCSRELTGVLDRLNLLGWARLPDSHQPKCRAWYGTRSTGTEYRVYWCSSVFLTSRRIVPEHLRDFPQA